MTDYTNTPTRIYSDFLNQSFSIPIYDFFYQLKNTGGNLELCLISKFLDKEEILFGILIVTKQSIKNHPQRALGLLKALEKDDEIISCFPDWDNPNKFFIKAVLTNEKILTRNEFINFQSPIGKIKLPPLEPINILSYYAAKQEAPLKITSHYNIIGERGFLAFYRDKVVVHDARGKVELADELHIADNVKDNSSLFRAWGKRVMKDHMLNYPFIVAFKWVDQNIIVDMIGSFVNDAICWEIPVFSLSNDYLHIFDIKKCLSYSVYIDHTYSYKKHINSIFSEVMGKCPVKNLICTHKKLIADVYWIDEREVSIKRLYHLSEFERRDLE